MARKLQPDCNITHQAIAYLTDDGEMLLGLWRKTKLSAMHCGQLFKMDVFNSSKSDGEPLLKIPNPFPQNLYEIEVEMSGRLLFENSSVKLSKPLHVLAHRLVKTNKVSATTASTCRSQTMRLRDKLATLGIPRPICETAIASAGKVICIQPPLKFVIASDGANNRIRGVSFDEKRGLKRSPRRMKPVEGDDWSD